MPLTELTCRTAKPKDKNYKLTDGECMFLLVKTNGTKCWQYRYSFLGKEKLLSFGIYPEVSIQEARNQKIEARKLLKEGIDPSVAKKRHKNILISAHENTFEAIAREWHAKNLHTWEKEYGNTILTRLENNIFPWLGKLPIKDIDSLRKP